MHQIQVKRYKAKVVNYLEFQPFYEKHLTENTAQKIKFFNKYFFSNCDQIHADLVTFTEEILNGKLHFLCSVNHTYLDKKRPHFVLTCTPCFLNP